VEVRKLVPVMVTWVEVFAGPQFGETLVTVGVPPTALAEEVATPIPTSKTPPRTRRTHELAVLRITPLSI
jgi:hypothetical protein